MFLSSVRPGIVKLRRNLASFASKHLVSDRHISQLLETAETRKTALPQALDRVAGNPSLAINILSCGVFSLANKVEVLNRLVASPEFTRTAGPFNGVSFLPQPPRFFSALARQSETTVNNVFRFWHHFDTVAGGGLVVSAAPIKHYASIKRPSGQKLDAIVTFEFAAGTDPRARSLPNSHEIDGYQIGEYEFYLLRGGPVVPCPWDIEDVGTAFGISASSSLWAKIAKVSSEGFYFREEIGEAAGRATFHFDPQPLKAVLDKGPAVISVRRHSLTSPIEVELFSVPAGVSLGTWAF
jgi:hypothetical protein